jgi:hypothetical protein
VAKRSKMEIRNYKKRDLKQDAGVEDRFIAKARWKTVPHSADSVRNNRTGI